MSLTSNNNAVSPATDGSGNDLTGKSGTGVINAAGLADVIEKSYKKSKHDRKAPFKEVIKDAPENQVGIKIQHPDMPKQDPREYLLIARVVKRNCRPLTVAEVQHQKRQNMLFKLDNEIRDLQKQAGFEN